MPREISDEEYNFLQSRRNVADFVEAIYNDPQLGREAKRLIKKKYPNLQIADLDIEDRVSERLDAADKARNDERKAAREADEERRYKEARERTQKQYGFTDEAMKDLETFMVERNVGDYEVAAGFRAAQNPQTTEPDDDGADQFWHHDKVDGFAEIAKDPEGWGRSEILKSLRGEQARARSTR